MTRKQLHKVMLAHRFLAVRWNDGHVTATNSIIALHGRILRGFPLDDTETKIVSCRPIGFQEYISLKIPYF